MVTTLTRQGMPVLRYRTKDITRLNYEPCACGRTHVRMEKVMGRTDDMLIIKGVNVFPSQIESVLVGMENGAPLPAGGAQEELPGYPGGQGGTYRRLPIESFWENCSPLQHKIHDRLKSVLGWRPGGPCVP